MGKDHHVSDAYVKMSPSRPTGGLRKSYVPENFAAEMSSSNGMPSNGAAFAAAMADGHDDDVIYREEDGGRRSWHRHHPSLVGSIALSMGCCSLLFASIYYLVSTNRISSHFRGGNDRSDAVHTVAFIGNSMFYFNDFPRFFEDMSSGRVIQNSCLHGGASICSLALEGNAMHPQFMTSGAATLGNDEHGNALYDYGACTVRQLLSGEEYRHDDDDDGNNATGSSSDASNNTNPCLIDAPYREYANEYFGNSPVVKNGWDYVVINDNTRFPARASTRQTSLETLESFYVPLLLETGSIPVFLWTHAYTLRNACGGGDGEYGDSSRNAALMYGLEDVANFTSLTLSGYRSYVDLLTERLPKMQEPRIAPVGLAFLVVYEENYDLWTTLFHCDNLHASPSGSFLQGCIVHYTLFGTMPDEDLIFGGDVSHLWDRARLMQHAWEPSNQFPDMESVKYLYRVAERVMIEGHVPDSFIDYRNGEVANDSFV